MVGPAISEITFALQAIGLSAAGQRARRRGREATAHPEG